MYSMFDLLFETSSYRPVYVISDSEMKKLKKNLKYSQHQKINNLFLEKLLFFKDGFYPSFLIVFSFKVFIESTDLKNIFHN